MAGLEAYEKKRDFSQTPEPDAESVAPGPGNRFVIQKHIARREHYDFRIEVGEVLVSWAIPKKPVLDPEVKRLAVKTEDHPLAYIHFEGTIPKGNYGAGTVMVWDYGYYYSFDNNSVLPANDVEQMLENGKVKLHLQGQKLKGTFTLVKINKSDKDEWLFMKAKSDGAIDYADRSALTGRTMEEISSGNKSWNSKEGKTENKEKTKKAFAEKQKFPGFVAPMLATTVEEAFSDQDWIYEFKLDGYRLITAKNGKDTDLYSRNGHDYNVKYGRIRDELKVLKANFVVDGEVCYMVNGRPDFQKLQHNYSRQDKLHYYVFDLLWLNGHDLKGLPLYQRKELLNELLANAGKHIHYLDHIEKEGERFFREIEEKGMEGIIAKRKTGIYHPGWRSNEWLKIKTVQRQEMVICGYIGSEKKDREFKSLLCCVYADGKFIYTGKVGTGFNEQKQKRIMKLLNELSTNEKTVDNPPADKDIHWVKPALVCEVKFAEWTREKVMRHPVFIALREDKAPQQIKIIKPGKRPPSKRKITLTNPEKIFWPDEEITKSDVYDYYESIAHVILPHLKNRPQSLYRTPDGIRSKGFFQKNMEGLAPDWVETVVDIKGTDKSIEYLLCQDLDTLLYMVNLGCIEFNPWNAAIPDLDYPDLMVFDLDPLDIAFNAVIDVAVKFRDLFEKLKMPSYCKTSGGRGLHIYVPIKPKYSHKQVQNFAKTLEMHVHEKMKKYTSLQRSPSKRKGKIYLDYLQNGRGKTMASVYSLRPRKGAPVSTPLNWDELKHDFDPYAFNIHTVPKRIEQHGDIWESLPDSGVDLEDVINRLQ